MDRDDRAKKIGTILDALNANLAAVERARLERELEITVLGSEDPTRMNRQLFGQLCAVLLALSWLAFLVVDHFYHGTVVPTHEFGASELYGPLSYFQWVFKYTTFALTAGYFASRVRWSTPAHRGPSLP
jgi:hypothetical protein